MRLPYGVGTIVYFDDEQVQRYVYSDAPNKRLRRYSEVLLIASYATRLCSAIKRDKTALNILKSVMTDFLMFNTSLSVALEAYEGRNKLDSIEVIDGLYQRKHKKEHCFTISYDGSGASRPHFITKGYGFLGKNVEAEALAACLLTIDYILKSKESIVTEVEIIATLGMTHALLGEADKLNVRTELDIAKKISTQFI